MHLDVFSTLWLAVLPGMALCAWPQCELGRIRFRCAELLRLSCGGTSRRLGHRVYRDNEQDSSHTNAEAGTQSSNTAKQKISRRLHCIKPTGAILTRRMHLTRPKIISVIIQPTKCDGLYDLRSQAASAHLWVVENLSGITYSPHFRASPSEVQESQYLQNVRFKPCAVMTRVLPKIVMHFSARGSMNKPPNAPRPIAHAPATMGKKTINLRCFL